jgi:hypothetical protein
MILTLLALTTTVICIAASVRRLRFAIAPTALDPGVLLEALRGDRGREELSRVREAVMREPGADWERALFEAIESEEGVRAALVNEQLTELDFRLQRWARVPRVCASIASSAGFLLAAVALRAGLLGASASEELDRSAIDAVVFTAINVAAMGVVGAVACAAIHIQAGKLAKARLEATDKLVERLEALAKQT